MTDEELEAAIREAEEARRRELTPLKEPPSKEEIFRRELILLRQQVLYEVRDAREFDDKRTERLHIAIYGVIQKLLGEE